MLAPKGRTSLRAAFTHGWWHIAVNAGTMVAEQLLPIDAGTPRPGPNASNIFHQCRHFDVSSFCEQSAVLSINAGIAGQKLHEAGTYSQQMALIITMISLATAENKPQMELTIIMIPPTTCTNKRGETPQMELTVATIPVPICSHMTRAGMKEEWSCPTTSL